MKSLLKAHQMEQKILKDQAGRLVELAGISSDGLDALNLSKAGCARSAACVHLTRFFGCLAPHAKIRPQIVPGLSQNMELWYGVMVRLSGGNVGITILTQLFLILLASFFVWGLLPPDGSRPSRPRHGKPVAVIVIVLVISFWQ